MPDLTLSYMHLPLVRTGVDTLKCLFKPRPPIDAFLRRCDHFDFH